MEEQTNKTTGKITTTGTMDTGNNDSNLILNPLALKNECLEKESYNRQNTTM